MLKYDHQLTEVKSRFPGANRILIVLGQNLNTDNLAASLSLYLSIKSGGKKVDIISTGTTQVSQSNLFGIGDIKNDIPKSGAGNYVISLDGVVDNTGSMQKIPALEKLDWYPEGSKLNLVFHVVPGQRFEPTNITTTHEQSGYDLTFVIGCQSLNELGNLFISNSQYFAQSQVINIDINQLNAYFGFANVIDPQASSISEIVAHILPSLTLNMDLDIASNIIAGIYSATNNLTQKVNPETFLAVSQAVQVGGTLPSGIQTQTPIPETKIDFQPQVQPQPQSIPQTETIPVQPVIVQNTEVNSNNTPPPVMEQASPNLSSSPFIVPPQDINIPIPAAPIPIVPIQSEPVSIPSVQVQTQFSEPASVIPQNQAQGFDLRQIFQIPQMPSGAVPANPDLQNVNVNKILEPQIIDQNQPQSSGGHPEKESYDTPPQAQVSPEERPMGEFATTPSQEIESTPTPDWLVPKIFKGGNLG